MQCCKCSSRAGELLQYQQHVLSIRALGVRSGHPMRLRYYTLFFGHSNEVVLRARRAL
jgi:hypothetical protein